MLGFLKGRLLFVRLCLLASVLMLVGIGVAAIYAVGHPADGGGGGDWAGYWQKQVVFAVLGLVGFAGVNLVNYRRIGAWSYWIYAIVLLLLVVVLVSRYVVALPFVPERHGAHRWIQFAVGGRDLPAMQPSEICKIAYILALAWYLRYRSNYRRFGTLIGPFALTLLPMVLILVEPDLGTVLLIMPVFFTMLFVAGAKIKHLGLVILLAISISPFLWVKMKPYQRLRISSVLLQSNWLRDKAEENPAFGKMLVGSKFSTRQWRNDWGYQLIRSKFAVASGGVKGYGFGQGPFLKYDFLAERHNDFIFSIIAHQWGLLGCLLLLGLYAVVVACSLEIGASNPDPFGKLIAVGVVAMFVVEVLINVGMTIGLMPITGLTLPFVSYGGSSLLTSLTAVGLLNNVGRCRPFTVAPKR